MSGSILRRLVLLLTTVAFVLATALPSNVSALAMPMEKPCSGCASKAPAGNDVGTMACGALACAGIAVGLPARPMLHHPALTKLAYTPAADLKIVSAAPAPDPFPPRPVILG